LTSRGALGAGREGAVLKSTRRLAFEAAAIAVALGIAGVFYGTGAFPRPALPPVDPADAARMPAAGAGGEYVSSDTCRSCHPAEYASWHASFHRTMTQLADASSVRGDFDGVLLEAKGQQLRLSQEGGRFFFEELYDDRPPSKKVPILMVTGSHHYQVYWFSRSQDRKIHGFPFVYLFADQRWVPRGSEMLGPPSEHVAKAVWNKSCLTCHSTHPLPRVAPGETDTQVAELGISCEACHGPGERHVEAMRDPLTRLATHAGAGPVATMVDPAALAQEPSAAICGQCHSYYRRHSEFNEKGHLFRPGDDELGADRAMLNHRKVVERYAQAYQRHLDERDQDGGAPHEEWMHPDDKSWFTDVFWPDGVLRAIGREYTGIEPSGCYQRGDMTCLSCHEMHSSGGEERLAEWRVHQLKPGMRGDRACTQCHPAQAADVEAHTHHPADSPGSACLACHMPRNAYGLLSARRNHQLQSPDALSASSEVGRVGGCNICHQAETLAWTAQHLEAWYGQPPPPLTQQEQEVALLAQHAVKGHAGQRVLAASLMGWEGQIGERGWQVPFLLRLLADDYDAVRIVAYRALRSFPGFEDFAFDYMAAPEQRAAAIAGAEARVSAAGEAYRLPSAALLGAPNGAFDEERYSSLRAERDLTPVWIGE